MKELLVAYTLEKDLDRYSKEKILRCPCCDRFMTCANEVAGHITSHRNGGPTILANGMLICKKCNNNDTRNIPDMMNEDWGPNHPFTLRVKDIIQWSQLSVPSRV